MARNGKQAASYNYLAAVFAMDELVNMIRYYSRWAERLLADEEAVADLSRYDRFGESFAEDLEEGADRARDLLRRLGAWRSPGGEWGGGEESDESRPHGSVPAGAGHTERTGVAVADR